MRIQYMTNQKLDNYVGSKDKDNLKNMMKDLYKSHISQPMGI
jgi:hypothetical protein